MTPSLTIISAAFQILIWRDKTAFSHAAQGAKSL